MHLATKANKCKILCVSDRSVGHVCSDAIHEAEISFGSVQQRGTASIFEKPILISKEFKGTTYMYN
jgi:hypothetical protein